MGDKGNNWIVTSPRQDIALLEIVAQDKDNFRNVIRICKRMKDTYNFLVSSFAIDTAAIYAHIDDDTKWENDLFLDLRRTLQFIVAFLGMGKSQILMTHLIILSEELLVLIGTLKELKISLVF